MMDLLKDIRANYNFLPQGKACDLKSLPSEYPAFSLRIEGCDAVAIPCSFNVEVSERFAHCKVFTRNMSIDGVDRNFLVLMSVKPELFHEFSVLCAEFIDPGVDGVLREAIIENPQGWCDKWKMLLGNAINEKQPYDVIAELIVLEKILKEEKNVKWFASEKGSVDIETSTCSIEVKSTIMRYGSVATISGQHQLDQDHLSLFFCRMEKSPKGLSINDMVSRLEACYYDKNALEDQLSLMGYERGNRARKEQYKILEIRKYNIGENFPRITKHSFKNDVIPQGILHYSYDVDLDVVPYENIEL